MRMRRDLQKQLQRKQKLKLQRKSSRKTKPNAEKTTLGDITQLAALKEEMEEKANKASRK